MLDQAVALYVSEGWTVESRSESQVVIAKKRKIGWFWNTVLAVGTGGLWLIVVGYKIVNRKTYRKVFTLDARGKLVTETNS